MTRIRNLALPLALALLGAAATPAHATLLVRSDGNGLLVQDKNGLNDDVTISLDFRDGQPAHNVSNGNFGTDIFLFDTQTGCTGDGAQSVVCFRNGPIMRVVLLGGNDKLNMTTARVGESVVGGASGNDKLTGHAGKDTMNGGLGEDTLKGLAGNDTLDGAENPDRLEGGDGNDTLLGQGNSDSLFGGKGDDVLRGGAGNDFIDSKEPVGTTAVDDGVDCGNGSDTVEADLKDSIQSDCENVDRSPVGETPHVDILGKTLRVSSSGRVGVRLRCPRGVRSLGCRGRLQLRVGRSAGSSRSRRVRYAIRAGRRKTVTLTLTSRDVRKLRGKRRRGILTSVERGRIGPKTTIRNPRLRLR